jgi:hypothetical protein
MFSVGQELFQFLVEVQRKKLRPMREAIYGKQYIIPEAVFTNPMLHAENIRDEFFLIDKYMLQGYRLEDPHKYDTLLHQIKILLKDLIQNRAKSRKTESQQQIDTAQLAADWEEKKPDEDGSEIDSWIKSIHNADLLFDFLESKKLYRSTKRINRQEALEHKQRAVLQKKVLAVFYRDFLKTGLIDKMKALFKVSFLYQKYCPPLKPQQLLDYLTSPKERKTIAEKLKRLETFYNKSFSLIPLNKAVKDLKKRRKLKEKELLIRYLKTFFRFHRDTENLAMLKSAMNEVNLVTQEKIARLSRENNTLYEFIIPGERKRKKKQIIHHVIIKADLRGSTDITYQMEKDKKNPASYFSLNFFNPITDILPKYGATKVFIEGDAMILAIFEYRDTPQDWYCVARACGLAANILAIIQQYNKKNKAQRLPQLELGIGICYHNSAPAFLYDGNKKIMISPAINLADRLSGCSRTLRKMRELRRKPYNLFVYQAANDKTSSESIDDVYLRYNVNGIQLNREGFKKLHKEIDLRSMRTYMDALKKEKIRFYTGKYPTAYGRFEELFIRQQCIPVIDPPDLRAIDETKIKYYEVCTDPSICEQVRAKAASHSPPP